MKFGYMAVAAAAAAASITLGSVSIANATVATPQHVSTAAVSCSSALNSWWSFYENARSRGVIGRSYNDDPRNAGQVAAFIAELASVAPTADFRDTLIRLRSAILASC